MGSRGTMIASLVLSLALCLMLTNSGVAEDCDACAQCSCQTSCTKVCRLVCEEKQVEVVCWGCANEEFCIPGPSKRSTRHCELLDCCDEELPGAVQAKKKKFVWYEWLPGGAKLFTRKKLMKRTVTTTVKTYKWVVEDTCSECFVTIPITEVCDDAEIPPVPAEYQHLKRIPFSTPK